VILCWVDAGGAFGLGHLSRTLAIAEGLVDRGACCRFALPPDPTALAWLGAAGLPRPLLLDEREPALPHVLAAAAGAAAVVVDVTHPLERTEARALGGACPLLVVDNAGPGTADAHLVLAPCGEPPADASGRWLVGPEHVPLRRAYRTRPPARPAAATPAVLVSMGASDPGGLTAPVVDALGRARAAGARLTARVIANPAAAVWHELPARLGRAGLPPACAVEAERMPAHLAAADIAVLAMGVTVYEAMATGVPAVVLCRTSGDVAHARALEERGAIVSVGQHWTEERLATAVGELVAAPARRAAMSRAGRALVDGRGAERVAGRLVALLAAGWGADAGRGVEA
jgi:spore coat polysaccharide biosynthesis protein SpsF